MSDRRLRVLRPRPRQQVIGKASSRLESKNRQKQEEKKNSEARSKEAASKEVSSTEDDEEESGELVSEKVKTAANTRIRGKKLDGKYLCNSCDSRQLFTLRQYMKHIKVVHNRQVN